MSGTFQVGVSCVCSPTKLTCCMQVQSMAFQLKSRVMVIMEMFGSSLCHLQHLVYSAQLGAPSEATLLLNYLSAQWRGDALQPGHSAGAHPQSALPPGLGK